jgi:threonine/homoserine/homoserine lactone efflux protein
MSVVLGICAGTAIWAVCGYTGITLLFKTAPMAFIALKIIGGGYLIYLGVKLLRSPKISTEPAYTSSRSYLKNFVTGLITNVTNPKTAVFVASLFAATSAGSHSVAGGTITTLLMTSISFIWYGTAAHIFSAAKLREMYHRKEQAIKKAAGAIFTAFGLKLILSR